jgi:hypothetical protein
MDYSDSVTPAKNRLFVLILGSYSEKCFDELENLREGLRSGGYANTHLTSNLDDPPTLDQKLSITNPDLYAYRKSIHYLEYSHVNLYVFGKDCPYGSVTAELIISLLRFNKSKCSSFLFHDDVDYETIPRGFLSDYNLTIHRYSNENDLLDFAKDECLDHIVTNKCDEEKEYLIANTIFGV